MKIGRLLQAALIGFWVALSATQSGIAAPARDVSDRPRNPSFAGSYWGDLERGWFWYEDPLMEPDPPKAVPPTTPPKQPRKAPELVELERLQKQLEDARKIAVIRPTEQNVLRYMRLEADVVRRATKFSEVAQRLGWTNAELDMSLEGRPVNPLALQAYNQKTSADAETAIGALARDHAIFFFFRSDCPYCHVYAPVLERFASSYGIMVVPISVDGGAVPPFESPRADNGISRTLNVSQVPATFLAQPTTGVITPIGFGVLSTDQLVNRLTTIASPETQRDLPSLSRRISLD